MHLFLTALPRLPPTALDIRKKNGKVQEKIARDAAKMYQRPPGGVMPNRGYGFPRADPVVLIL